MEDKHMLMIPGPTPVPESVLLAMAKHPIGHRSGAFSEIMAEVTENLQWLFTGTLIAMTCVIPLFGWISSTFPRRRFLPYVYSCFILMLLVFYAMMSIQGASPYRPRRGSHRRHVALEKSARSWSASSTLRNLTVEILAG